MHIILKMLEPEKNPIVLLCVVHALGSEGRTSCEVSRVGGWYWECGGFSPETRLLAVAGPDEARCSREALPDIAAS